MKFEVTTVVLVDLGQNIAKFYRTFVGDDGLELRQNGRIGTVGAVAGIERHPSQGSAHVSAEGKVRTQLRKGYNGQTSTTFDYPDDKLPKDRLDKDRIRHVFQAFQASGKPGSNAADLAGDTARLAVASSDVIVATDSLDALLASVMTGINTAIADPSAGDRAYAELTSQIKEAHEKLDQVQAYFETLEDLVMA